MSLSIFYHTTRGLSSLGEYIIADKHSLVGKEAFFLVYMDKFGRKAFEYVAVTTHEFHPEKPFKLADVYTLGKAHAEHNVFVPRTGACDLFGSFANIFAAEIGFDIS